MPEREKILAGNTEQLRQRAAYAVRLPGFVSDEKGIGLGDVITRAAYRVGVRPCVGCAQRAATLNKWVVFKR
jgi:hypothetical protein